MFEMLFDREIFDFLCEQSIMYAKRNNEHILFMSLHIKI